ncbi:MAG: helix-turn-helix domain-containing protein [Pirellulales bacterium]
MSTTLLTLKDTANELNTDDIHILRLIARGKLAATRLGETKERRVTREALTAYIDGGAQDLEGPPMAGVWFDEKKNLADFFWQKARNLLESQRIPAAELKERYIKNDYRSFKVQLTITPEIRDLMNSKPKTTTFTLPDEKPSRLKTLYEAYAVYWLQHFAKQALTPLGKLVMEPLAKLYDSQENYAEYTGAAMARFLNAKIGMRDYAYDEKTSRNGDVDYELSNADMADKSTQTRLLRLAF